MWDCGSRPESAEHTSHEPRETIYKDPLGKNNNQQQQKQQCLQMLFSIANVNGQRFSSFDENQLSCRSLQLPQAHWMFNTQHSSFCLRLLVYLAAGQVQGSVLVLIQQRQVSLGPVKEDGCMTGGESLCCHDRHPNPINRGQQLRFHDSLELGA